MSYEEAFNTMLQDPQYQVRTRLSRSAQHLMWDRAHRVFKNDPEYYLSEMEKTDKSGPGKLELNPDMHIPEYTKYEIHTQPGGYVGDPFAGWLYHYALALGFFQGKSDHDEIFLAIAQNHPLPKDGKVLRVLDIGCGAGQSTTAIKERFPNAEVWGIDVGGPMVRYAHYRAAKMGLDVNFAQRLAEDTKFPDGYFDLVTDHIVFHEIPAKQAKQVVAEMHRV
jgi:SAM-dependent methyltransferase